MCDWVLRYRSLIPRVCGVVGVRVAYLPWRVGVDVYRGDFIAVQTEAVQ